MGWQSPGQAPPHPTYAVFEPHALVVSAWSLQEHPRPGGHGWVAVRSGGQRWELQPELHREVQPPNQQVGSSLLHVHTPEQRGGGCAGTPQLPAPLLAHPVGVFDEPLTKNQDLPYLKGTGAPGGALGQRGWPHGAAGRCRRRAKVLAAASSLSTPVNHPRSHPHSWCAHRISTTTAVRNVLPGRAPTF